MVSTKAANIHEIFSAKKASLILSPQKHGAEWPKLGDAFLTHSHTYRSDNILFKVKIVLNMTIIDRKIRGTTFTSSFF